MNWFVISGEKPSGPFTSAELQSLARKKSITGDTLVRKGTSEPFPAMRIKGLFDSPIEDTSVPLSDFKGPLILGGGLLICLVAIPITYVALNKLRDYRAVRLEAAIIDEKARIAKEAEERKEGEEEIARKIAKEEEERASAIAAKEAAERDRIDRQAEVEREKKSLVEAEKKRSNDMIQSEIDMQKFVERRKSLSIRSLNTRPVFGEVLGLTLGPQGLKKLSFNANVEELTAEWTAEIAEVKDEPVVKTCGMTIRGLLNYAKAEILKGANDLEGISVLVKVKIKGRDRLGNFGMVTILEAKFPTSLIAKMNPDGLPYDELFELGNARISDSLKSDIFRLKSQ